MSVNPASPMKNINVKRVGTRGLGSITRKDNRSDISLSEAEEKKRHHRIVLSYVHFRGIVHFEPHSSTLKLKSEKVTRHLISHEQQGFDLEAIEMKFPKKIRSNLNNQSNS